MYPHIPTPEQITEARRLLRWPDRMIDWIEHVAYHSTIPVRHGRACADVVAAAFGGGDELCNAIDRCVKDQVWIGEFITPDGSSWACWIAHGGMDEPEIAAAKTAAAQKAGKP